MRLPEGIVVDAKETFGELKFSALHGETYHRDGEGNTTGELKNRKYDLKCAAQRTMISVLLAADVEEKKFEYDTRVELVNPRIDTVANATYGGNADSRWYIYADDIVAAAQTASGTSTGKPQGDNSGKSAGDVAGKGQPEQTVKKG